ncbi:protein lifeguard 1-like [Ornithodoros turicata]|uniref:protein lifeguard 1-like n=1 Tax=Ornithodoros turicata TaxID=34597 RepID=UPI003139FB87
MPISEDDGGNAFSDKAIRRAFIRKVYLLLMLQLVLTCAVITACVHVPRVHELARQYYYVGFICMCVAFVMNILVCCCCSDMFRCFPCNFIFLFVFTGLVSVGLGCATAFYKADEVMLAVAVTAVVFLALTIFAMQSMIDFTVCSGVMFCFLIVLILFGILVAFLGKKYPILRLLYACAGALIFSVYIIVDTQLIMGGHRAYAISPEDYILACLTLYVDIINLFQYILQIIRFINEQNG